MTLAVILDKRRETTTGENAGRYHVKIRLTYTRDKKTTQRYYVTGVFATEAEFRKIMGNPGKDKELQDRQAKVFEIRDKGKAILEKNPFITADDFGDQLLSKGSFKDPLGFMLAYAAELEEEGRIGTRDYYMQAHSCFNDYSNGTLYFAMVTPKWLMKWEKWMLERGRSITTVAMYARAMRKVFKLAMSDKYKAVSAELYPFGDGKYVIPESLGRKLALDEQQKDKLLKYPTLVPHVRKSVDMWIFSYFCQGINFADIARLRYRDIQDEVLRFERTKTIRKRVKRKSIVVVIRQEVRDIIARHGNKSLNPNEYIFPVLRDGLTPEQIKSRVHDFIKEVNDGLEIACRDLEIPKITTYWARHTFATIAKRKGASTEFIQEALGHADIRTTEAYLDSFDLEAKKKIANML